MALVRLLLTGLFFCVMCVTDGTYLALDTLVFSFLFPSLRIKVRHLRHCVIPPRKTLGFIEVFDDAAENGSASSCVIVRHRRNATGGNV